VPECPACTYKNLPGEDPCEECGIALVGLSAVPERSGARTLHDTIRQAGMREPVEVRPATPVREVLTRMRERNTGCAVVVDRGQFVGIFTERDALEHFGAPDADLGTEVGLAMTAAPELLYEHDSVAMALNKMAMGRFRHIPVQRDDGRFSVFSVRDALLYFF
jgi:CBS domain-containing protein